MDEDSKKPELPQLLGKIRDMDTFWAALNKEPSPLVIDKLGAKTGDTRIDKYSKKPYIPVGKLEDKLDYLFGPGMWWTEHVSSQMMANEIATVIHLKYIHPVHGHTVTFVGHGAKQMRYKSIEKGSDGLLTNMNNKLQDGLKMDFPNAGAAAFKNACQKLGKWFGRDMRRKEDERGTLYKAVATGMLKDLPQYLLNAKNALMEYEGLTSAQKKELVSEHIPANLLSQPEVKQLIIVEDQFQLPS